VTYETVRGMRDILPEEVGQWTALEAQVREVARRYNYREIRPPIVEYTDLFTRGIGEATDVVGKEMFTFPDKKGRSLTLRPEATASVVRAYVEHGLYTKEPFQKLFYVGPMFRYEKPQKGRSRQFHQYGIEAIGSLEPSLDVEVIEFAWALMESVGLGGLSLRLNSIGCAADRERYRDVLRAHFRAGLDSLCEDCQRRYVENPLRILDCKDPRCQSAIAAAPGSSDHLCPDCAAHFADVRRLLDEQALSFRIDPRLVRGLDYYTRTVFELVSEDLGAQDALLGGGRYDDLVERLGGPSTPGVGFAGGMDRLALVLTERGEELASSARLDLFLVALGESGRKAAVSLARALRQAGVSADLDYRRRPLRKQMAYADALRARTVLVLGEDEVAGGKARLKDMDAREEEEVPLTVEGLSDAIAKRRARWS